MEKILTTGMIRGEIKAGKKAGDWEYLVVNTLELGGEAGVVVIVVQKDRLIVKTVEWIDP